MSNLSIKVYFPQVRPEESRPVFSTEHGSLGGSTVGGWRVYCADTKNAFLFPRDYVVVIDNVES